MWGLSLVRMCGCGGCEDVWLVVGEGVWKWRVVLVPIRLVL